MQCCMMLSLAFLILTWSIIIAWECREERQALTLIVASPNSIELEVCGKRLIHVHYICTYIFVTSLLRLTDDACLNKDYLILGTH